jgi:hypothetical protein
MNYTASESHKKLIFKDLHDRQDVDDKTTSKYPNFMHEEV